MIHRITVKGEVISIGLESPLQIVVNSARKYFLVRRHVSFHVFVQLLIGEGVPVRDRDERQMSPLNNLMKQVYVKSFISFVFKKNCHYLFFLNYLKEL